jgi:hypothetical protein
MMADKHPYVSGSGSLVKIVKHFRKSFPGRVTAETLQKLGFAPKNESYVLNVLRFLGLIDKEGKRTEPAAKIFNLHDDAAFSQEFARLVKKAYGDLFELHGDSAWVLDTNSLITFFRSTDDTTAIVGKRQASTFQLLAAFSGQKELPAEKPAGTAPQGSMPAKRQKTGARQPPASKPIATETPLSGEARAVGLTVRVEVNLPADGDQETYDRIFKSIRDNLLNG